MTIDTSTPPWPPQPVLLTNTGTVSAADITDANNSASTATATGSVAGGQVTTIAVTSGGSGYTSVPDVTFNGGGGQRCDGDRHPDERRGHLDHHHQPRQWLHLGRRPS